VFFGTYFITGVRYGLWLTGVTYSGFLACDALLSLVFLPLSLCFVAFFCLFMLFVSFFLIADLSSLFVLM